MRLLVILLSVIFLMPNWLLSSSIIHKFNHIAISSGLSSKRTNNYVFRDSNGYVWISSNSGLNRYDGYRIKQYHQKGSETNALVREVASQGNIDEDINGDIWFAGGSAVTRYNHESDDFTHFRLKDAKGNELVKRYKWSYLNKTKDTLLFGAKQELYYLAVSEPERLHFLDSTRMGYKDYMTEEGVGKYLLVQYRPGGEKITIKRFSTKGEISKKIAFLPTGKEVFDVVKEEKEDVLWVGTSGGLYRYDISEDTWKHWKKEGWINKDKVVEVERFEESLIIGTEKEGIYVCSLKKEGLPQKMRWLENGQVNYFLPEISRLYVDPKGNLFVSTTENGVFFTNLLLPKMSTYGIWEEGRQPVYYVCEHPEGGAIILYRNQLEWVNKGSRNLIDLPIDGLEYNEPTFVFVDSQSRVFVGTYDKLYMAHSDRLEDWRSIHLHPAAYTFGPGYNNMIELPGGELLLATNKGSPIAVSPDLKSVEIFTHSVERARLFCEPQGQLLAVATYVDTLHLLEYLPSNGQVNPIHYFTSLPSVTDLCPAMDRESIWVGTMNGLYKIISEGNEHVISLDSVIGSRPIYSLELYGKTKLLLGSTGGLIVYDFEQQSTSVLTTSDGIQGVEFAPHASLHHSDGSYYFGGYNGANYFRSLEEVTLTVPPVVDLVEVSINQEKWPLNFFRTLSFKENNIEIEVKSSEIADVEEVRFTYTLMVKGNTVFSDEKKEPRLSFYNLSPSAYRLLVSAKNSDGVKSEKSLLIPFTILPPWYRTWWAYTLYALTIAGIAFAFFWIRLLGIRKLEKEQLRTAKSDARAAETEARAAENETSVLRLQMNPHFIFNSLNSVNSFIETGKTLQAQDYLYKFADLIRDILRRSEQPLTRLDQAIQLLTDYLEAEQMRMGDRLNFTIEEDDELDTFSTYLPTMIVQPFVENAIWHGIGGREEGGTVTLRFGVSPAGNQLVVEVEDDGVGRNATAKSGKKHASKAMDITRRRLDLLNSTTLSAPAAAPEKESSEATLQKARFEIQDLKHPDDISAGTRILLYLPLNYEQGDESNNN